MSKRETCYRRIIPNRDRVCNLDTKSVKRYHVSVDIDKLQVGRR